jgi:hypothetical protein
VVGTSRAFGDVTARAVIRDAGGGLLRLLAVGGALSPAARWSRSARRTPSPR